MRNVFWAVNCAKCDKEIGFESGGDPLPYIVCSQCRDILEQQEQEQEQKDEDD